MLNQDEFAAQIRKAVEDSRKPPEVPSLRDFWRGLKEVLTQSHPDSATSKPAPKIDCPKR